MNRILICASKTITAMRKKGAKIGYSISLAQCSGFGLGRRKKGLEKILNPLFYWYARLDSNQRLSAPEADALSPELRAQKE